MAGPLRRVGGMFALLRRIQAERAEWLTNTTGLLQPAVRLLQSLSLGRRALLLYGLLAIPTLWLTIDKVSQGWHNVALLQRAEGGVDYARAAITLAAVSDDEWRRLGQAGLPADSFSLASAASRLEQAYIDLQNRHRRDGTALGLQDQFAELSRLFVLASSAAELSPSRLETRARLSELAIRLAGAVVGSSGLANKDWIGTSELAQLRLQTLPRFEQHLRLLSDEAVSQDEGRDASVQRLHQAWQAAAGEFGTVRSLLRRLAARSGVRCTSGQDETLDRTERLLSDVERRIAPGSGNAGVHRAGLEKLAADVGDLALGCDAALVRQLAAAESVQRGEFIRLTAALVALYALAIYLIAGGIALDRDGIRRIRADVERLARGDLGPRPWRPGTDELSETLRRLGKSTGKLAELLGSVKQDVGAVAHTSGEVARASQSLARGSNATSTQLREFGLLLAKLATQLETQDFAFSEGVGRAAHMIAEAGRGNRAVTSLDERIAQLQRKSREIAKIVGVIEGISHQTNLLSLNAAIQASKAGESGKGFAVVAQEVRNLAQRVGLAAQHIGEVVASSEQDIEQGHHMVKRTRDAVLATEQHVRAVGAMLQGLSTTARAASSSIGEVQNAMSSLGEGNAATGRVADQMAIAATQLRAKAQSLSDELNRIRLTD